MDKNKFKDKLTVKNINKTFGTIIFVLVFLFTFLWGFVPEFKNNAHIFWPVAAGIVFLVGVVWLVMVLVINHKTKANDVNQQKISKALEKLEEQAKEESKKQ